MVNLFFERQKVRQVIQWMSPSMSSPPTTREPKEFDKSMNRVDLVVLCFEMKKKLRLQIDYSPCWTNIEKKIHTESNGEYWCSPIEPRIRVNNFNTIPETRIAIAVKPQTWYLALSSLFQTDQTVRKFWYWLRTEQPYV